MLVFVAVAEALKGFVEHVPSLTLLVAVPIAIVALGFFAAAVAAFVDQQLPLKKP